MSDRLARSILATVGVYLLTQLGIFSAFAIPAGFLRRYGPFFFIVSAIYHVFLLALLFIFKQDFVKESTGERLERVNMANRITMFRLTTLPTLLFLIMAARDYEIRYPLLALVMLIFATDFADGYVSRKTKAVTKVGRMMDSASDYSLIIVLSLVFYYFSIIPRWFFILVSARLGLQSLLVVILIAVRKRIEPKTTPLGKLMIASVMTLYTVKVFCLLVRCGESSFLLALDWITSLIIVVSMGDKLVYFFKALHAEESHKSV